MARTEVEVREKNHEKTYCKHICNARWRYAGTRGPEEDPTGGFTYGGWMLNYWDDMMWHVLGESMAKPFELLLGRKTYDIFAAYWPNIKDDPAADKLNSARKYVVSGTLEKAGWNNSKLIKGNVVQAIRNLKEQKWPEIHVHGSGNLIQMLLKHDLVDEFRLWIFPGKLFQLPCRATSMTLTMRKPTA
jgi:dihydrofolate reductase